MKRFDITLKTMLQRQLQGGPLARLMGFTVREWLDAELPEVRSRHADLLVWTVEGDLVQVELQSFNDPDMTLRMAEYALAIFRRYRVYPRQVVLYVGQERLLMAPQLNIGQLSFRCDMIDIRSFEADELLASPRLDDNVLAVRTRFSGKAAEVRGILQRIAAAPAAERKSAVVELMIPGGLRQFGAIIEEEIKKMPIVIDLNTHTVFGPHYRRGLQEGLEKGLQKGVKRGLQEGVEQGLQEGVRQAVQNMIVRRFGKMPLRYSKQLAAMSAADLQAVSDRLFDAGTVADLFR